MSYAMQHGLGDCTPDNNCGCIDPTPDFVYAAADIISGTQIGTGYYSTDIGINTAIEIARSLFEEGLLNPRTTGENDD